MRNTLTSTLVTVLSTAGMAGAAIIPSWRINPIPPGAALASPQLAGAISISLLVELTGESAFDHAGLNLDQVFPNAQYFHHFFGANNAPPPPTLNLIFPDLPFDTYVCTTDPNQPAALGSPPGMGVPPVGIDGQFNVGWGAFPNTTASGEIARITFLASSGITLGVQTPLIGPGPGSQGLVSDQFGPVGLPPMPVGVPEPAAIGLLAPIMLARRRLR